MVLNPRSELVQLAALLTQLIALAQAVEQLRRAQERQVQARAARLAAEHLSTRQQGPAGLNAVSQAVVLTSGPWDVASPLATPTGCGPMHEPLVQNGHARTGPSRR
jgi:hypothetical protein